LSIADSQNVDWLKNSDIVRDIIEDNSLTFSEKALSIKSADLHSINSKGSKRLKHLIAGEIAIVNVDLAMAQDSTCNGSR
jgi:hypothetical protein